MRGAHRTPRPLAKRYLRSPRAGELEVYTEGARVVRRPDPTGALAAVLELADGTRDEEQLAAELTARGLAAEALPAVLAELDGQRLLEDASADAGLTPVERERATSNLAFFGGFASLGRSRSELQRSLIDSSVLLLGVGGVGTSVLTALAGLGIGTVTAVDFDRVELRNLSRQSLYTEDDIGREKLTVAAERARRLNPRMAFRPVTRRLSGPEDVADLLGGHDLVLALVDQPPAVKQWVNEACVAGGVPYVAGGVQGASVAYWSVDPGTSGCLSCLLRMDPRLLAALTAPLASWPNTAVAPAAMTVGGLIGMEAVRYLTGIAPPVAAARLQRLDLVTGELAVVRAWDRRPDCGTCGSRTPAVPVPEPATASSGRG